MIHSLLGVALVIFVIWLVLVVFAHVAGFAVHLLWILILAAIIWWLVSAVFGRGRRRAL